MLRSWRAIVARFRALLRSDAAGVRAGFVALLISSGGDLLAGLVLGSITGTLRSLKWRPFRVAIVARRATAIPAICVSRMSTGRPAF